MKSIVRKAITAGIAETDSAKKPSNRSGGNRNQRSPRPKRHKELHNFE